MTTNEQRDTAAILQMRKDLDEARELLRDVLSPRRTFPAVLVDVRDFLARTEPKHGETK